LDEKNAKALYNRGHTHLALSKNELALEDFDTAISLEPNNSKHFHGKGLAY
jgi:hypothetical protein